MTRNLRRWCLPRRKIRLANGGDLFLPVTFADTKLNLRRQTSGSIKRIDGTLAILGEGKYGGQTILKEGRDYDSVKGTITKRGRK